MNHTELIIESGFDFDLFICADVIFEDGGYDVTSTTEWGRYVKDLASYIEAFFNDEAAGLDENGGDYLYKVIQSGKVNWETVAEVYGESRWEQELNKLPTEEQSND